jgi:DNA gyrase subunit A
MAWKSNTAWAATAFTAVSDTQAQEILQMRLQRLTGLEQDKIVNEYKEVMAEIDDLLDILARAERVVDHHRRRTVRHTSRVWPKQSGRTSQLYRAQRPRPGHRRPDHAHRHGGDTSATAATSRANPCREYRAQKRGGRGKQATATKEDDWIEQLFIGNTHDYILCFSNRGRLYWLKVWEVPEGSRGSRGRPIVNMFPLAEGEKINVVLPLTGAARTFPADQYVFMATSMGTVKKTSLDEFQQPAQGRHHRGQFGRQRLPHRRSPHRRQARCDVVLATAAKPCASMKTMCVPWAAAPAACAA